MSHGRGGGGNGDQNNSNNNLNSNSSNRSGQNNNFNGFNNSNNNNKNNNGNTNGSSVGGLNQSQILDQENSKNSDPSTYDLTMKLRYLEKSIKFIQQQHNETLSSLHQEIENLKNENRGKFLLILFFYFVELLYFILLNYFYMYFVICRTFLFK